MAVISYYNFLYIGYNLTQNLYVVRNYFLVIARSCSQAPALNEDSCSNHVVNIMRARVCLCRTSLCNGLDAFKDAKGREEFER